MVVQCFHRVMEGGDYLRLRIPITMAIKRQLGLDLALRHLIRMSMTQAPALRSVMEVRPLLGAWARSHQGLLRGALVLALVREHQLGMLLRPDRRGMRQRHPAGPGLGRKRQRGRVRLVPPIHIKMVRKVLPRQQVHGEVLDRRRLPGYRLGGMRHLL